MPYKEHFRQWDKTEDALLEVHYNDKPLAWLCQKLNRSDLDIRTRAHVLGVKGVFAKEKKIVMMRGEELTPKPVLKAPPKSSPTAKKKPIIRDSDFRGNIPLEPQKKPLIRPPATYTNIRSNYLDDELK